MTFPNTIQLKTNCRWLAMPSATSPTIHLIICVEHSLGWHAFDNTEYHCWDLTASASNTVPITCEGFDLRWITTAGDTIKVQEHFSLTYELIVNDDFYTWAFDNNYFDGIGSISNAADAKTWCVSTSCPAAASATKTNCCVWHVNVHSCPLADTVNGLCGPWIQPSGATFTHSDVLVGNVTTGNWTSEIAGLYKLGVTSLIAHFKIAGMQLALETKTNVVPRAECGDNVCETDEGEDCESCPKDCGKCPLKAWQLALIGIFGFLLIAGIAVVFLYFQYQKRKLLWDESWIIPFDEIKHDDGLRAAFGSMIGSTADLSNSDGNSSLAQSATRRQVFVKTALYRGRTCAMRAVRKREFTLTKYVRLEVREVRACDHVNVCKFIGASIMAPNIRILTEYCPKGSLSDVLLNDDVPLNWAFRFSFATDISRGMQYLHNHKIYHGRLKSNNCVIDDRWTVKVTDFGIQTLRTHDEVMLDDEEDDFEDNEDEFYQEKRAQVYKAPEFLDQKAYVPTIAGDVYAFSIILVEIATRNDPYGDEDAFSVEPGWKPPMPNFDPELCENKDDICPCPAAYMLLIDECWNDDPNNRLTFDEIKKTVHKINPSKLSPVDLMMAMMEKYSKHLEAIVTERTQDLVAEKAKTDRLLYSMLPKAVADDLRHGRPVEAKYHDGCTIYFSDIVGFTNISGGSTAMEVVALLNKLYITFDEIIDKYDVYKVETIGDAYMVVSGIPISTPFHAREIADMSIDLVRACEIFTIPHMPDEPLKIRVGLHSGSACAGVVGLKMPRYCLFGDTVNTASRMESNGEAYKIHISNFTYMELVQFGKYTLEKRGTIPVKGKGEMLTWWLTGIDPAYIEERKKETTNEDINKNSVISVRESNTKLYNSTGNICNIKPVSAEDIENQKNLEKQGVPPTATYSKTIENGNTSVEIDDKTVAKIGKVIQFIDTPASDYMFTPVEITESGEKSSLDGNRASAKSNIDGKCDSVKSSLVEKCDRATPCSDLVDTSNIDLKTTKKHTNSKIS
ncbi:atrial natriuretic peptide receptor 1-like [Mercenaria mercenaria]|uniref:atrial natriuretic peptide receptor 1-like n=1 Tax=Mercenaria mercenaria TaxID=6596 RepID=UPI00234EC2BA|nr:atrial natriuretic peptide receptor 1-like [Mercenaria mercenaria]